MSSEMDQARDAYNKLTRLRTLDREAAELRKELGFSRPGEIVFNQSLNIDRSIVVVASGYGSATLQVVDGEYDSQNSQILASREYTAEGDALAKAEKMIENDQDEEALEEDEE